MCVRVSVSVCVRVSVSVCVRVSLCVCVGGGLCECMDARFAKQYNTLPYVLYVAFQFSLTIGTYFPISRVLYSVYW